MGHLGALLPLLPVSVRAQGQRPLSGWGRLSLPAALLAQRTDVMGLQLRLKPDRNLVALLMQACLLGELDLLD